MYYTKLIIQDHADTPLNDAYHLVMEERWKLLSDGNGRTKYTQSQADGIWIEHDTTDFDAVESKDNWDSKWAGRAVFPAGVVYHALVKIWNTQAAAESWVSAVEALALDGVTISYHGTTDPTV